MYKRSSRAMQHAHRVDAPLPTGGYIDAPTSDDDILKPAASMTAVECKAERAQLLAEMTQTQAQLSAAKSQGRQRDAANAGRRHQALGQRLSLINSRVKDLNKAQSDEALRQAILEVAGGDLWKAILARQIEILSTPSVPASPDVEGAVA